VAERYSTIIADPPWQYQNWTKAKNGAAASSFETMSLDDIGRIPVSKAFAAKDAVLVLWATWPKLDDAFKLLEMWGFSFVTGFPWVKYTPSTALLRTGVGFWTQGMSEVVLIARRGKPRLKGERPRVKGLLCGSDLQFYAPRSGQHSRKPYSLHEWAEASLDGPYLELFARRPYPGWTCYGDELGWTLGPAGASRVER